MFLTPKKLADLAYSVTQQNMSPFQYRDMYKKITKNTKEKEGGTNHCENFRTWIDNSDCRFTSVRKGSGWFTLTEWIKQNQLKLISKKTMKIDYDKSNLSKAAIEVGERLNYIYNKYNDTPKTHFDKFLKGKIPEEHIKDYFSKMYPTFYVAPQNNYDTPDKYDFLLDFHKINRTISFDVKTIGVYNGDLNSAIWLEKNRINDADIYIGCTINGCVNVKSFICLNESPSAIEKRAFFVFTKELWHDMYFLIVYLNHLKYGFDIKSILKNKKVTTT